jgi:phospholipid/cholesterol/gamma-HCH transport system ATP-binding protein
MTGDPVPSAHPEIVVEGLWKSFDGKAVLSGIDLRIDQGELVAIVGGSGCGKTVLLKHVTGHLTPDRGRVLVADHEAEPDRLGPPPLREIASLDEAALDRLRVHWAVVFQRNALLTGSVHHNLAIELREVGGLDESKILPLAEQALREVGLDPDLVLERDRDLLSGGMAKRVAIARALVMDPVLVLYDEPTAGLDPEMCEQIHELIRRTHATTPSLSASRPGLRRTSVVVTHDTGLLQRLRPRVVMLNGGRIIFDGDFDSFMVSKDAHIRPYLQQMHGLQARSAPI